MQVANTNNKCFIVWSNEIKGRIDPLFYHYEVADLKKNLSQKYKPHFLSEVIEDIYRYPTFYGFEYQKTGIPIIKGESINEFGIINNKQEFDHITESINNKFLRTQLERGDLIFTVRGVIGKVGYYEGFSEKANINANVIKIRIKKDNNPKFFWYFLNSAIGQKIIQNLTSGQVQKTITVPDIKNIQIPLIIREEQDKIVAIMQTAYDKKASKEQEAENILNSIDDYILGELEMKMPEAKDKECFCINSQEVDNGRLDCYYYQPKFKEAEKSFKKANCKIEPLKNYITKIHYGASLKNTYVDEGIPLLRIQNLKPNKVVLDKIVRISEARRKELGNAFVSEGDLLISRSGSVGIVSVVPKEAEGFAFGSFMIKFCLNDKIDKDFVSVWLNNKISQLFIKREKIGAIQGNITIETIENLQIPIPSLEIQKKLAGEIKERIAEAKKIRAEVKNEIEKAKQEVEKIILGK